jgi:hypothetical protein
MRIYYRGADAVVTSRDFLGGTAPARHYAIRDLRNVHITRSDAERLRPTVPHLVTGLLIIALAAWPLWRASRVSALVLAALVGSAVLLPAAAAVAVAWRLRPQRWELRATYRGADVALYASADERVFNQVSRALRRAIEDARPPSSWDDRAAA